MPKYIYKYNLIVEFTDTPLPATISCMVYVFRKMLSRKQEVRTNILTKNVNKNGKLDFKTENNGIYSFFDERSQV